MNEYSEALTRIDVNDYTYHLPPGRIAYHPSDDRDAARLLVCRQDRIADGFYRDIHQYLDGDALMVFNDTRVVQARIEFFKETGARIEVFCLHPEKPSKEIQTALGQGAPVQWHCLVGNAKKWKGGDLVIRHPGGHFTLYATIERKVGDGYLVNFRWEPSHIGFAEILGQAGKTPLPPYILREATVRDKTTYQTMYASKEGSVAAPTAGLHFTPGIFEKLEKKGIKTAFLTLHVGAGTFKPVMTDAIGDHLMHAEQFAVDHQLLSALLDHEGPVVPVGTTSMRTLESLYWLGAHIHQGNIPSGETLFLSQWAPYEWKGPLPDKKEALNALARWLEKKKSVTLRGETALIIVPGYGFRMSDALVTNFHQPGSTLLLLVAAFAGEAWRKAYRHALAGGYRFLSYGDGCLFFK